MANIIREHRIVDNNKRALIKYVLISDGTAESNSRLVDASTLSGALNVNNQIMVSNTHPRTNYRTTIKRIFGQSKANGYFTLNWQGDSNSAIVIIPDGGFDYNFESLGDIAVIPNPEANATGDILLTSYNNKSGDAFTLFIDIRKNSEDYHAGQFSDPVAFNRGPAAP
jgi:hypothetical protein